MSVTALHLWFPSARTDTDVRRPDLRLFCVPHGGAGTSVFRSWPHRLGPATEVVPVQLPGRESRLAEPAERSVPRLAARLAGPVARRAEGLPYILFGHSMGALVAFELGLRLQTSAHPPAAVVVSGSVAPHLSRRTPAMHLLPDREFLDGLRVLGGIPPELLADREWLELFLPQLRADFEAAETYVSDGTLGAGVRLIALGGRDDPAATPAEIEGWRARGHDVSTRVFDGDHFFPFSAADQVLATVMGLARRPVRTPEGAIRP
ncbi:thioesterase II family protein [Streptomyces sp. NPDC018693]|uniref:thioesterase II family protein n=1 Tax=unclassified Streptomyces TaxID=2593676 RepID=UPI0037917A78